MAHVGDGAGGVFQPGELKGADDVGEGAQEEHGTDGPEEGDVMVERLAVGVEGIFAIGAGRQEDLEIAQHMAEDEAAQDDSR